MKTTKEVKIICNKASLMMSVFLICSGFFMFALAAQDRPKEKSKSAGESCFYDTYKGRCRITSIGRSEDSRKQKIIRQGSGYEGYEVRYRFIPLEPLNIAGPKLQKEDIPNKRYLFLLANSWYPGEKYLVKYGIREGAVLKCEINIINRGTCSPVLFRFTDLNTTDYFESQ